MQQMTKKKIVKKDEFAVGKTKLFMKSNAYQSLESALVKKKKKERKNTN